MSERRSQFSHTTVFLRNRPQLEELTSALLPQVWPDGGTIEALICGGSIGCEALSLLVALREFAPDGARRLEANVLSIDVAEDVNATGRAAQYPAEMFAPLFGMEGGMPDDVRARWFEQVSAEPEIWRPQPELADRIEFRTLDPMAEPLPRDFDLIFCQNVLTHYDPPGAEALLDALLARARERAVFVCSGVDLNLKAHIIEAGFRAWTGRLEEIHDAFASHRLHFRENRGQHYFELEDIDRGRPDWEARYSTLFYR